MIYYSRKICAWCDPTKLEELSMKQDFDYVHLIILVMDFFSQKEMFSFINQTYCNSYDGIEG